MPVNKLLLILILGIVFISGCNNLKDVTIEYEKCLYYYVEGDTMITNDVSIGFDVWMGTQIDKIVVINICPDLLEGEQKDCIMGYMKTKLSVDVERITIREDILFNEESSIIDCENKCTDKITRKNLKQGYQKIGEEGYEYENETFCWE